MIHYNPRTWWDLIFHAYSKEVIMRLWPSMAGIALLTIGLVALETRFFPDAPSSTAIHSLLGFALSLFLVFRTNTAYDRWWEGRRQWGELVNHSRSLAMKIHADRAQWTESEWEAWRCLIPNFASELRYHLRGQRRPAHADLPGCAIPAWQHTPAALAQAMFDLLAKGTQAGRIEATRAWSMEREIKGFVDIMGACERIMKTPIPYAYSMFMKKFIFLYVVTLPLGLVGQFQWWSVPIAVFIFYILVSIELIAEEIEDPFGEDANDLPTDDLAQTIAKNVAEILGDSENQMA
jgi:putative membrane protein